MNDKERARLDRLTLANMKLQKSIDEKRKDLELAKAALKEIREREHKRTMHQKTREQLQNIGVLIVPKTD